MFPFIKELSDILLFKFKPEILCSGVGLVKGGKEFNGSISLADAAALSLKASVTFSCLVGMRTSTFIFIELSSSFFPFLLFIFIADRGDIIGVGSGSNKGLSGAWSNLPEVTKGDDWGLKLQFPCSTAALNCNTPLTPFTPVPAPVEVDTAPTPSIALLSPELERTIFDELVLAEVLGPGTISWRNTGGGRTGSVHLLPDPDGPPLPVTMV